jgi:hypothetical protein
VPIIDSFADGVLGHKKYGNKLVLVDTRGFDDANKTAQEVPDDQWVDDGLGNVA